MFSLAKAVLLFRFSATPETFHKQSRDTNVSGPGITLHVLGVWRDTKTTGAFVVLFPRLFSTNESSIEETNCSEADPWLKWEKMHV